ncbi:hypothetical protein KEM56_005995 [Ascosphaera pollenicola]|nr:hypothetical protein KEM56_005995 [Ascosphaera pollenicola]
MGASKMRPWKREEVDALLAWMDEHKEVVRGKMNKWCQQVKDDVFEHNDDIQWTKIKDKYHNMRRQWLNARKLCGAPEYLIKEGDLADDLRAKMVAKCPNFFRLEEILVLSQGVPDGSSTEYPPIAEEASIATGGDETLRRQPSTSATFRVPLAPKPPRSDGMDTLQRQFAIFGPIPSQNASKRPASAREDGHDNVDINNMVDMRHTNLEPLLSPQEVAMAPRKRPRTSSPEGQSRENGRSDLDENSTEARLLRSQWQFEQRMARQLTEFQERMAKQQADMQKHFSDQQAQFFDTCLQTQVNILTDAIAKIKDILLARFGPAN